MSETIKSVENKKWYKSPMLPWSIIIVTATLFIGVIVGWNLREDANNQAKAAAAEMVTTLSKEKEQK